MFLRNLWYFALAGARLRPGRTAAATMLGEPLLLARTRDGQVFAIRDICPHRGAPLSRGRFDGAEVECPYHGWRFGADGVCRAIPSLVTEEQFQAGRIRVGSYPCREIQGNVWVFFGDDPSSAPAPPVIPELADAAPRHVETMRFPCDVDHAVVGLMDPAHGPFVHTSWWWRSRRSIHAKEKAFGPSPLGFTMLRHAPSRNSAAYKLLGGEVTTEIAFRLPGIRIERVEAPRGIVVGLTAVTPVDENAADVHHAIWWTIPMLAPLRPFLGMFARSFLGQDRRIVAIQAEGLRHRPHLMLIDDADTQAKWYYRLKREWQRSQDERRPFENPVEPRVLRWRS